MCTRLAFGSAPHQSRVIRRKLLVCPNPFCFERALAGPGRGRGRGRGSYIERTRGHWSLITSPFPFGRPSLSSPLYTSPSGRWRFAMTWESFFLVAKCLLHKFVVVNYNGLHFIRGQKFGNARWSAREHETLTFPKRLYWTHGVEFN